MLVLYMFVDCERKADRIYVDTERIRKYSTERSQTWNRTSNLLAVRQIGNLCTSLLHTSRHSFKKINDCDRAEKSFGKLHQRVVVCSFLENFKEMLNKKKQLRRFLIFILMRHSTLPNHLVKCILGQSAVSQPLANHELWVFCSTLLLVLCDCRKVTSECLIEPCFFPSTTWVSQHRSPSAWWHEWWFVWSHSDTKKINKTTAVWQNKRRLLNKLLCIVADALDISGMLAIRSKIALFLR